MGDPAEPSAAAQTSAVETLGSQMEGVTFKSFPTLKHDLATSADDPDAEDQESDDDDEDDDVAPIPFKAAEKRLRQNATFSELLSKRAEAITADDVKQVLKVTEDSKLSMANLIAKQDFASVIHDPREYQIELFEKAKQRNVIAVLDTGSGKTLIAVLLLKHTIEKELADRAAGMSHRISFFLVDSVTLMYQQAAVLKANIDQNVGKFCGAMGTDLWNRQTWVDHFSENMVIVCTAEVLHQCLLHSFITMDHINLLIFDEAHHAKKDHPYARIVKDFYLKNPFSVRRPRIFGMTASPVDAKGDVVRAASALEMMLDSQIATTSNLELVRQTTARPDEQTWTYDRLGAPFETELSKKLRAQFGNIPSLKKLLTYSLQASSELGSWCSDWVWSFGLAEEVLPKLKAKVVKRYMRNSSTDPDKGAGAETRRLQDAGDIVQKHDFGDPLDPPNQLSPKVQLLHQELMKYFERNTDTKCIVFVEQRHTARILCDLFSRIGTRHLRPGVLIGVRVNSEGTRVTFRQQFLTLLGFRNGEYNCLFATSVAEEGLDIPDCNLVIRFDLYPTLIKYVQSRGRARQINSTYVHMVERDNLIHETRLQEVAMAEQVMREFCETLPEDRILKTSDDADDILEIERYRKTYTVKSTGAKLTYGSSLAVLAHYASSLQYEKETSTQVNYVTSRTNDAFVCEVILPEKSPIRGTVGKPASRKSLAKQAAAFQMCVLLRERGLLDEHFVSTYHKRLPAMRNAKLAIKSKKTNQYDMQVKPKFWTEGRGATPNVLHATVLVLRPSQPLARQYQHLVLLSRHPLPELPNFPLYLEDDVECEISCVPVASPMDVSAIDLDKLSTFTLRIFQELFHKVYEREDELMSYWLAPAKLHGLDQLRNLAARQVIDWEVLTFAHDNIDLSWHNQPPEFFRDRFVFDKWDGKYRYFTRGVEPNLRPSDALPEGLPRRRHMSNILNYCLSLFKNSREKFLATCDWNQPVLGAELISLRRNLLDRMTEQERKDRNVKCYICPEPLVISALPSGVAAFGFTFPAIITRIDAYLIALEACEELQLKVPPALALEAMTKDSDNTEEHRSEQIHFQRGMGKNYERLEFLGDCFLKMGTSISLFAMNPDNDEFDFHVKRMLLICNQNLFNTAVTKKLYEFVRTQGFSRRGWYPEGLKLLQGKTKANATENKHALADKTIADICEALIGASLLSGAPGHRFDMAVKAVTALVNSKDHDVADWQSYYRLYSLPEYQIADAEAAQVELAKKVEDRLGYHFKYPRLLRSAFTHPSYPTAWGKVPSYQRLEFLGDSLLDMACVEFLYKRHPDKDPQWLTEHKMAMVSNKFLGSVAVKLGLHRHLNHFSNALQAQITSYAEEFDLAQEESKRAPDSWTSTTDPPKCLPDMVEAYLGAIFVDSEFDYRVVEDFFSRHLQWHFEDMSIYDTFANKHPTTFLHNRLSIDFGCTNYCLKAGEVPFVDGAEPRVLAAVIIHETIVAEGIASSTRYAKVKASENALKQLEGLPAFRFRERFGCDCQIKKDVEKEDDND